MAKQVQVYAVWSVLITFFINLFFYHTLTRHFSFYRRDIYICNKVALWSLSSRQEYVMFEPVIDGAFTIQTGGPLICGIAALQQINTDTRGTTWSRRVIR